MALPRWIRIMAMSALAMVAVGAQAQAPVENDSLFMERQAIEKVLYFANLGYELFDAEMYGEAFAEDAVYILDSQWPIYGYDKLRYEGREDIESMITSRTEVSANPDTMSYNPATLRRFNRSSNEYIEIIDSTHARHYANWMVVMRTNVDIHTSAIGRYEDDLVKLNGQWFIQRRIRKE